MIERKFSLNAGQLCVLTTKSGVTLPGEDGNLAFSQDCTILINCRGKDSINIDFAAALAAGNGQVLYISAGDRLRLSYGIQSILSDTTVVVVLENRDSHKYLIPKGSRHIPKRPSFQYVKMGHGSERRY